MDLQVAYTVAELARMTGLGGRRLVRLFEASGVRPRYTGRGRRRSRRVYMLSEIKAAFPDLWESMLDRLAVARIMTADDRR